VIVHQDVAVKVDSEAFDHFSEQFQEMGTITIIAENGAALVAAGGDVVPSAWMLDAKRSGHFKQDCRKRI
jgi:hypothetical protein